MGIQCTCGEVDSVTEASQPWGPELYDSYLCLHHKLLEGRNHLTHSFLSRWPYTLKNTKIKADTLKRANEGRFYGVFPIYLLHSIPGVAFDHSCTATINMNIIDCVPIVFRELC